MKDGLSMMPSVATGVGVGGQWKKRGTERPGEKELASKQSWKDFTLPTATSYIFYILGKMSLGKWFCDSYWGSIGDECLPSPPLPIPCISIEGREHQFHKKI